MPPKRQTFGGHFNITLLSFCRIHLFQRHRFGDGAELAESVGGDDIIEFVAMTGEVAPRTESVVADEVCELVFSLPLVDEFGNEIDARLNSKNETGLQRACRFP